MTQPPVFKHYLKQHREARGLRQSELAEKAGTYTSVISRFENGQRAISLEMAVKLARALDIRLDHLLEPPGKASPTFAEVGTQLAVLQNLIGEMSRGQK